MAKRTRSSNVQQLLPSQRVKRGASDAKRREKQAERLGRVLRLLELLSQQHGKTLADLADELEFHPRTIRRDLRALASAGYECDFDKLRRTYQLQPRCKFPWSIVRLSEDELMGQVLAGAVASAPGMEPARGAGRINRVLTAQLTAEVAKSQNAVRILTDADRLISVVNLSLADHSRSQKVMRTAQDALLANRQVVGAYGSPHQAKPIKLRLHPYRLCLVKQAWYLIARPVDEEQPKTYRIARFKSLQISDEPASVPDDFDLRDYFGNAWAVYRGERTYDVQIEFSAEAAPLVLETIWHSTQDVKQHRDGRVTLTFKVDGLDEIVHWVLGWSGRAKVVKPRELRALVVGKLQAALKLNGG